VPRAEHFLPLFGALFPQAPAHQLHGVGHDSLEDAPEPIAARVAVFRQQT